MKYLKFIVMIAFLAGFTFIMGCKDDDPGPSDEELRIEALSATWTISSTSLDGVDRTADWGNFTLTVTGEKTYSTSGSGDESVWPTSGTWDFQGTEGSGLDMVNRSDGVAISISNLTESTLDLTFTYALAKPNSEARVASIEGEWLFKMTK